MKVESIATQPSNSLPPSQRGVETLPALDAAFLIIISLVVLLAIAVPIYACIPKRRQPSFSFKPRHKILCYRCRYFSGNHYLKCDLPAYLPPYSTVFWHYKQWRADEVLDRIMATLHAKVRQQVKKHPSGHGC